MHGFTGTPASMAPIASVLAADGIPIDQPLLPGHGTEIADLIDVEWHDWLQAVQNSATALGRLADEIVVIGQSMGATLALALALAYPVAGLVLINPLTQPRPPDELELIDGLVEDGIEIAPGGASDIADPTARDAGYTGTPLRALRSLLIDGVGSITDRFGELNPPMLLFTSRRDHVVDPSNSEHLADTYGGLVEHRWLDRSFHVAAIDYDRDQIATDTLQFVKSLAHTPRNS